MRWLAWGWVALAPLRTALLLAGESYAAEGVGIVQYMAAVPFVVGYLKAPDDHR